MIDVDKVLKVMRADLPANFDKGILASELRKAKSWYQTRSKLDKWPKREKIVGRFITDTKRYRAALKAYSEACQDIPLPFRLPSWLNTEALDAVIIEAEACMRPLHQNEANKQACPKTSCRIGGRQGIGYGFFIRFDASEDLSQMFQNSHLGPGQRTNPRHTICQVCS